MVYELTTGDTIVLQGHSKGVNSLSYSPDGDTLVSGSDDKTVIIWDPEGEAAKHRLMGHRDRVLSVSFSNLNSHVCSGSKDNTIIVWDCHSGDNLFTLEGHTEPVANVTFSPTGFQILSGSLDKEVILWDLELAIATRSHTPIPSANLIHFRCTGHSNDVRCVSFSSDGNIFVSAGNDQTVLLWDTLSGEQIQRFEVRGNKERRKAGTVYCIPHN